jgi:NAD(P)-dependent dehydrogenase (short-subunit alcohol dehydrogenase family)
VAQRLKDKVCIITGTGDGMGRAAALLFCSEGAKVVGCDLNARSRFATPKARAGRWCRCILPT